MFYRYLLTLKLIVWSVMVLSAPPIANLNVSGSIIPPTCTLNNQIEDIYTYRFDISPGIFPGNGNLTLRPQTQNIEVICDAVTYLTFIATDQRAGTELLTGSNFYGLGTYNTNTKIGYFAVRVDNVTVKSHANSSATQAGIIKYNVFNDFALLGKNILLILATGNNQPAAAQIFAADFTVTPTINSTLTDSVGDAELDGLAVLTFAFGL